jgi:hypothetical protein
VSHCFSWNVNPKGKEKTMPKDAWQRKMSHTSQYLQSRREAIAMAAKTFNVGDAVEILVAGKWEGPYIVTDEIDPYRPDHLVLRNGDILFAQYNDAPYNTRKVG